MKISKKAAVLFILGYTSLVNAQTWVHGSLEYVYAIPQVEANYSGEEASVLKNGIESEIYHNIPYLPNIKYDIYKNNDITQSNKTLYYSTYYRDFHLDFGGTLRDVEFKEKNYNFKHLTARIKTKVIGKVIGSFTYNYELDGKVKEYIAGINYKIAKSWPLTMGFEYKSSKMNFEDYKNYEVEGIFLKAGLKF